jgi:carboxylate-amine ligase
VARTAAAEADAGLPPPRLRNELLQSARWRAARYGLDGTLVDLEELRTAPARDVVEGFLAHLRGALEDQGDWDEVTALVERTLAAGNGAARQRAAFARRGQLGDVIELLRL